MPTQNSSLEPERLDVRPIPCREKHARIFNRWSELKVGESFILVNDHDPVPLYYQFSAQFPECFSWTYRMAGPEEYHVEIKRLKESPAVPVAPPPPPPAVAGVCGHGETVELTVVDARGLEPPEPMMRILSAVEQLGAGETLKACTDRRPVHLFPELESRGFRYRSEELADGSWVTEIVRD